MTGRLPPARSPAAPVDRAADGELDPLERLLERVLREAAAPIDVPPERLAVALLERRRRAGRRRAFALLAAAAVLSGSLLAVVAGIGGREAVPTPAPSSRPVPSESSGPPSSVPSTGPSTGPTPTSEPLPLPEVAFLSGRILVDHAEPGSPTGMVARRWIDVVDAAATYQVAWVCSGPGAFAFAIGEEGTARLAAASEPTPCDGRSRTATFESRYPASIDVFGPIPIYVTVDRRAAWRLVIAVDPFTAGGPTPPATGRTSLDTPGAAVIVYDRAVPFSPLLVVDAVGPDGDRGRVAVLDIWNAVKEADEILVSTEGARFDGSHALAVSVTARTLRAVTTERHAILVFDLRAPGRPLRVLFDATSSAWGPDGRLAYFVGGTLRLLDPASGTETVVEIPPGVRLADGIPGDGVWLADGSGFLTARFDPARSVDVPGVLGLDGTFRSLDGPTPPVWSPTGLPRYPAHGGQIFVGGCDVDGAGPSGSCGQMVTFGPNDTPVQWWDRPGPAEWTADGTGLWVFEGSGIADEPMARLVRVVRPGEGEVVASWEAPRAVLGWFVGMAPDDSVVLIRYDEGLPSVRWIDTEGGTWRDVRGVFAGWVRP